MPHHSFLAIKLALASCVFALYLASIPVQASQGIDTTTTDLPFSIGGTQVMDLTTNGLNIMRGNLTLTGCVMTGSGAITSANCPFTSNVASLPSMARSYAGSFTGSAYGVYGHGTVWAGYFDGPVNVAGNLSVSGTSNLQNTNITGQACLNGTCITSWPNGSGNTHLYACPMIAIYGSDGGGTGCVGQVSTSSTCNTYSTGGSSNGTGHTFTAAHPCTLIQ